MAGPNLTLRQLHYLAELATTSHFRRAAERVGVTQPSLSAQIATLERALGVRLIERGAAAAVLTPIGREVTERARRILADVQALADLASGDPEGLAGTLRMGVSPTLGPYLMPHIVARLHKEHPELKLHVREGTPEDMVRDLAAGVHDVVLAQLPVAGDEFVTRRLFRERLYIAMASDDPLAALPVLEPQALQGRALLTLSPRYKMADQINALGAALGCTILRDYEGTSLDAIRQMAGMGMGLALLPALYVRSEIRDGDEVVVRLLKGKPLHRDLGLVWRKSAGRTAAYDHLAELVVAVCKARGL